ncbi:cation:proton antiporter [Streptacidiphilus jiangxiensis]|uniref:cation:proton antiporter n=1 Tax=Streptacidiphilus jiangxiensis TaxID=235985 RepID=UPI001F3CB54A|nr:cation:proton antiporter [Streptacidiphilus jiangxiensis]
MTSQQVLVGAGLTVVLAVGSQILASRLRIPAIIVLLPAGFVAGVATDSVHPDKLIGPSFAPLVSLAVAVILYDAGLGLDLRRLTGHTRRTVLRLVWLGAGLTLPSAAFLASLMLGMSGQAATMLGAVLVVSGPTVVGPLLAFVRPTERVRRVLLWEGTLIDAVGGILGALVYGALVSDRGHTLPGAVGEFLASTLVGLAGGLLGAVVLWWLLSVLRLGEILGTTAQLATVVGVAALCDAFRDDAGLVAAIVMGVAVATLPRYDLPARQPFFETLVSLVVGLLFISISASVTPTSLHHVVLPALGLAAVLVAVVRPVVAELSTLGTDLARGERGFLAWMAPRGIVAASTAATFSSGLTDAGIGGADKILPATFVVIVATVTLYGLTALPVARRLHVVRPARSRPLLVGGAPWVVDLALALREAGVEVLVWAGRRGDRERVAAAGLELAEGELLAAVTETGAEELGLTSVFLLGDDDEFNALASSVIDGQGLPVYHLGRAPWDDTPVAAATGAVLFEGALAGGSASARYASGARITARPAPAEVPAGHALLFTVDATGKVTPVTDDDPSGGADARTAVTFGSVAVPAVDGV